MQCPKGPAINLSIKLEFIKYIPHVLTLSNSYSVEPGAHELPKGGEDHSCIVINCVDYLYEKLTTSLVA